MAAGLVTLNILDGDGTTRTARFWSSDGTTSGLLYPPAVLNDSTGAEISLAPASTGTTSQVASSASAVTVLAANAARKGASVVNDSTAILYLILSSTTPTSAVYTVALDPKGAVGAYYEAPAGYTGIIKGIWASANGNAVVTELT